MRLSPSFNFLPAMALVLAALFVQPARAVDPTRTLAQLHHTAWTSAQGAPGKITGIVQTAEGFLWLASPSGLHSFDGMGFEPVRTLGGVDIADSEVTQLEARPDGGIWLSFGARAGAAFYKNGRLTRYGADSGLSDARQIVSDRDDHTWFVTGDGRLWRVPMHGGQPGAVEPIAADWNVDDDQVARNLAVDAQGTVWLSVRGVVLDPAGNLFRLRRGERKFTRAPSGVGNKLAVSDDGLLWGTTATTGLLSLPAAAGDLHITPRVKEPLGFLRFDRHGVLWIQSAKGLARVRHPHQLGRGGPRDALDEELLTPARGLSSNVIWSIFEDREGNIWVGTSAGLDRLRDTKLVHVPLPRRQLQFAVAPGDNGSVWAANWDAGVLKVTVDGFRDFNAVPMTTTTLHRDLDGAVWLGNTQGLWRIEDDTRLMRVRSKVNVVSDAVRAILRAPSGEVWLAPGGGNGVWRRQGNDWARVGPAQGFPEQWLARAMLIDTHGRIWFAHQDEILLFEQGRARAMNARALGLEVGDITTLYARGDRIWVLGAKGTALFDGERFRSLVNPGSSNDFAKLTGMVETAEGDLWLNARSSLLHVARGEVERGLAGPSSPLVVTRLREGDGFHGGSLPSGPQPSMAEASDGRIWIATDAGLAWIDPRQKPRVTLAPQVVIRQASFDGAAGVPDANGLARTPPLVRQLKFSYTAASLAMPERLVFRYRLQGVDSEWQDAGARREAFYTQPGPGRYRFEVMAADGDGVWSKATASYTFDVPPAWFQTWWFRLACGAAAVMALWLLYRLRVWQLAGRARLREQLQQVERARIARDLHDTLLQSVTGLILRFQAVADGLPADGEARARMAAALERADGVLLEGRDCVSNLRDVANRSLSVELALADEAAELARDAATRFEMNTTGAPRELQPAVRDEFHKVGREALANAFRHARANRVLLELHYGWRELVLRVSDDGVGMDAALLAQGREGHWGLAGMRERAHAIGARCSVTSRPDAGTTVELRLRARRAYAA